MILLVTGTEAFSFHRLVAAVDDLAGRGAIEQVFAQIGSSEYEPRHCEYARLVPFEDLAQRMREAHQIVAHAGAGTILLALQMGQRPIVVPRRGALGEHLDDHQLAFAQRLDAEGLVRVVLEVEELERALGEESAVPGAGSAAGAMGGDTTVVTHLRQLLAGWEAA